MKKIFNGLVFLILVVACVLWILFDRLVKPGNQPAMETLKNPGNSY